MLDYTTLFRCMQQIRAALRSGDQTALAAQLDSLDVMVGPQKVLDIYGRLLLEETSVVLRPVARRAAVRDAEQHIGLHQG